jgi:hypothetical protein
MKTYSKTHTSKKARDSHIAKINRRGGGCKIDGNKVIYRFADKDKDNSIKAKTTSGLIIEAATKGYKKVKVEFFPAYDSEMHGNYPKKLKDSLKKSKVETFDVIEDSSTILKLTKSKDVKIIYYT